MDTNLGKSFGKLQENAFVPNKPTRPGVTCNFQRGTNPNAKTRCFNCQGFGHLSFQYPTKVVATIAKEIPKRLKNLISQIPRFKLWSLLMLMMLILMI